MEFIAAIFHFFADFFNAFVKPLAPYFIDNLGIDNKTFASFMALLGGVTSLFQVFFGAYFDNKKRDGLYITIIVLLEIFFVTFLGIVKSVLLFFMLVVIIRMLNSIFHPIGASFAGKREEGKHVAIFSVAGTLGAGIAPLFITSFQDLFGIEKLYILTVTMSVVLLILSRKIIGYEKKTVKKTLSFKGDILKLWPIFLVVASRSFSMDIFHTYIPIYVNEIGKSLIVGGSILTFGMMLGVFTNFFGTIVLEKTNDKITNAIGFFGMGIFGLLFVLVSDIYFKVFSFIIFDGFSFFTMSSNIVSAQKLLPNNKALASSISMGFSWAVGILLSSGYAAVFGNNTMFMFLSASIMPIVTVIVYLISLRRE
ncbi:MFS transporter [Thermosipho melanesiensis]|uniref:Major facilitator superfamily MFS_1 n=2 Tax=Thermosipho melanesiensis TaxID=46541 RepID=A6LLU7_THEM4|nr:MFS transporter [Thermosipho melanesiensis]ABR30898.1 major facilitator superfamily MFS_1 [Thermosipho melanesiensis BI429]APT74017.1 MFS transporter [Thermosipho melanesiensis]OOC35945.1 MFS transporter [Thermosipho melanesiensis]OOC38447.1 MFS transporter [Thermosipho melanesiensis]OOC38908.1 MFS transporter [Thermosipho melanesiensis]